MALHVFGGGPGDVTSNAAGDVVGGIALKAYTAPNGGQQVTELYDTTGQPLAGVVVSQTGGDNEGRVAFQASDQYSVLYLDAGYGMRWAVPAQQAFTAVNTALERSTTALTAAQQAEALATDAGAKADLASEEVDAKLGFDITRLAPEFVTQLRGDPSTVVQSFARDALTGQYYASQALGSIGGTTNLVVARCAPDGSVIDTCTFEGGGHGSTTAIERDGQDVYLWFRWTYDSTGGTETNRMVRAKYQPGVTVKRDDPDVLDVPDFSGDMLVNFDIDQAADRIAIRVGLGGTTERYALYRLSDYKSGRNEPIAQLGPFTWTSEDGPYQGHCTLDDHLYLSQGNADTGSQCTITRINWETGQQDVININDVGRNGDTWPGGRNEAEGVTVWRGKNGTPSLLFGKAVGSFGYRQALVYSFTPPAGDPPSGETLRSSVVSFQAGKIGVRGGGGSVSSGHVKFRTEFDQTPLIVVSPDTTSPGSPVQAVSYGNVTPQGFDVFVLRTNTSITGVSWMAYAGPAVNPTIPG